MLSRRKKTTGASRRERLRPDDFDDVEYSVEVVRLGESAQSTAIDAVNDRVELAESAFVVLVGAAVVALALVAGVVALEPTAAMAHDALWYLLPMVLLPALWYGVLHAWETLLLTPASASSATTTVAASAKPTPPPRSPMAIPSRRASKVAIF